MHFEKHVFVFFVKHELKTLIFHINFYYIMLACSITTKQLHRTIIFQLIDAFNIQIGSVLIALIQVNFSFNQIQVDSISDLLCEVQMPIKISLKKKQMSVYLKIKQLIYSVSMHPIK